MEPAVHLRISSVQPTGGSSSAREIKEDLFEPATYNGDVQESTGDLTLTHDALLLFSQLQMVDLYPSEALCATLWPVV